MIYATVRDSDGLYPASSREGDTIRRDWGRK